MKTPTSTFASASVSKAAEERKLRKLHILTAHRVGVFSTLTNAYAIVAVGASENFYRCVEAFPPSGHGPVLVAKINSKRA